MNENSFVETENKFPFLLETRECCIIFAVENYKLPYYILTN